MAEWDEEMDDPSELVEAANPTWDMQFNSKEGITLLWLWGMCLGQPLIQSHSAVMRACLFLRPGLQVDAGNEQETAPIAEIPAEVAKELARANFPAVEGDKAPHVLVPKACQSIQKQITKLDAAVAGFQAAESLTQLQTRSLVK